MSTSKERAERTYKELQKRKELKQKGIQDADDYMFDRIIKAKSRKSKINCKSYRGK